jgi:thiol-disulfide isomerase/thioredoxin
MFKNKLMRISVLAVLACTPILSQAQLLRGVVKGVKIDEVGFTFSPDGDVMNNSEGQADVAADGTFTYDPQLSTDWLDVNVLIGDDNLFGVHLVKGKTVEMCLTKTDKGYTVEFSGDNAKLNRFVNKDIQAFDMMKYFAPDPADAKPNAVYRSLLDSEYKSTVEMLKTIKGDNMYDYYAKLVEAQYKWMKIRLIMDKAYDDKTDYKKDPEFISLIKDVDVNDDINLRSAMSLTKLNNSVSAEMKGSNEAYCDELMTLVNEKVTNPMVRRMMVRMVCADYFTYGDGTGDTKGFLVRLEKFAGKDSDIVEPFKQMMKSKEQTKSGKVAPDITLNTIDGKQVKLSSLLNGKFTYIDVWATWCGPCCKEIPHLEKLVEQFKNNDKVQFISISTDQDVNAWKAKLAKDKPQWAQYILTPENDRKFSLDWGITGIPRFIMIDNKGNIFSPNATRPSDVKTATTIEEQTK